MRLRLLLLALLLLGVPALKAASTTVSGTITDAQGAGITGSALISWDTFVEPDGALVSGASIQVAITSGSFSVSLAPNVGSTPSGTSYRVLVRASDGSYSAVQYWVVPNTGTATLAAVVQTSAPSPSLSVLLSQLSIAGISAGDLISAGAGPSWARLPIGAEGEVLTVESGIPGWAAAAGGDLSAVDIDTFAEIDAIVADQTLVHSGSNVATATALAADGADCTAGLLAAGVDASGVASGCADPLLETELDTVAELQAQIADATLLTTADEGSGNGIDADTVDGIEAAALGGASEANDLTDVTITARAADDILIDNGSGAYVNEQILAAIGSRLAIAQCVLYEDNAGGIGCDADITADGLFLTLGTGASKGLKFGTALYVKANVSGYETLNAGFGQTGFKFSIDGDEMLEIGGSQTALIQDTTATTGDTSFIVKAGAGQSSNLQEWQNSSGTVISKINSGGDIEIGSSGKFLVNTFWRWQTANLTAYSGGNIRWSSDATASGLPDLGINRGAAGVLKVTDGFTGYGILDASAIRYGGDVVADGEIYKGTGADAGAYTDILTAIGEDLADGLATVASGSLGIASGVVTANAILTGPGNGNPRLVFTKAVGGPGYTFRSDTGTGFGSVATGQSGIWANSVLLASFGGTETALIQDTTATTGDTSFIVKGGAGQASAPLWVQTNAAGNLFKVEADGDIVLGTGARLINGPSTLNLDTITYFASATPATSRAYAGNGFKVGSGYQYLFSSTTAANGSADTGLARSAAGVVKVTDGSTGFGRIALDNATPTAASDACTAQSIWADANYVYVCVASGDIRRSAIATW